MSTTIKRVALVAVAALGLGVMSVAPSQAAAQLDSISVSAATATQVTGETLTAGAVVVTSTLASNNTDTLTVTASIVTGPAYSQPTLALKETTTAWAAASASVATVTPQSIGSTVTQATGKFYLYLNAPTVAGTYVVRLTPTGGTNAVATTVSITVTAAVIPGVSATYSTVAMKATGSCSFSDGAWDFGGCVGSNYPGIYSTATDTVTATATLSNTNSKVNGALIASFKLRQSNGASNTMATTVPWTVAITSGPGNIQMGYLGRLVTAKSVTEGTTTSGNDGYTPFDQNPYTHAFFVSDGTPGISVITFTAGGVLIATRTISVVGAATGYVFGTPSKGSVGVGETASVTVTGVDALGTTTGAASVYAFSSDATVATVNATQASTVVITGVKSGKATITVGNASTIATSTITKTIDVTVGALTAAKVALSFDNATPQPGEKVTVTVTATDASGNAVGDGTRALFSSTGLTTSLAVQGSTLPSTANVDLVGGKATYTFYAPTGTGSLALSATEGTATDSTTKAAITGTVTVINPAVDAATDAANEAAQAASDATDAALAAADAADAATTKAQEAVDAVATLSAQVSKMITALKAQITTLTNLVIKIQKKVKA